MLLAYVCILLHQQQKITTPCLVHVNHHLQSQCHDWAALVANFARRYGVLYELRPIYLADDSENGARRGRYQAFFEVVADDGVLLLGHHLDDNAETVLMRLVNGTSLHGLTGIAPYRLYQQATKQIHICRPLLAFSRQEITTQVTALGLPFVDDPTNTDGSARAVIRTILPQLAKLNPQVCANIHRTSTLLAQSKAILAPWVADSLQALILSEWGGTQVLAIDKLQSLDPALQMATLALFIKGKAPYHPPQRLVTQIHTLCLRNDSDHQSQFVHDGFVFCRYDNELYRYPQAFWHSLAKPSYATDTALVLDGTAFALDIMVGAPFGVIQKIDHTTKIRYRHKVLSGKKLYQTLRIPVWLRTHLYLADYRLMSFGHCWQLGYPNDTK